MKADSQFLSELFSQETLDHIFPDDRADRFFDALLGDAAEGAYDIRLVYKEAQERRLLFELELHQRPGKCLACNLTYGLPTVFARHPVIDVQGIVDEIDNRLNGHGRVGGWQLGKTREISRQLHAVPLQIDLDT